MLIFLPTNNSIFFNFYQTFAVRNTYIVSSIILAKRNAS